MEMIHKDNMGRQGEEAAGYITNYAVALFHSGLRSSLIVPKTKGFTHSAKLSCPISAMGEKKMHGSYF